MVGWLKNLVFGSHNGNKPKKIPVIRARYDAATISENNRKHWANADSLSAKAANSPDVRQKLRNHSRYEVANNSYARGIVLTLANDCIGSGPRLQMQTGNTDSDRQIEAVFQEWSDEIGLAEKLRTMRMAKAEDGESFAVLINNPELKTKVKLDLKLIEADQVTSNLFMLANPDTADGIFFDRYGNARSYSVLKNHPGDNTVASAFEYDELPAKNVIHYFRIERPGQVRGIPEITAALPLFAMLREYSLATLDAAKAAAYFAGVLYTDAPPNSEAADIEALDSIELERNMLVTMPGGWRMGQIEAQQPVSTFREFHNQILNEIARCLNMPFNVASGNSSGYNYASGRLDHQIYLKSIVVERAHIGLNILDRIFSSFIEEAALIEGLLPESAREFEPILIHQWFWDGWEPVDQTKDASARETELKNNMTTLAQIYAKKGQDWETELRQRAKEMELMKELGLSMEQEKTVPVGGPFDNPEEDDEEDEDDGI